MRKASFLEFCSSPGILNKNFVPFDKRNCAKLSKLLFLSPEDHLSCFKNLKMHKCVDFSYLQPEGLCESFWQSCRKCTSTVQSNISRKTSSLKICFFLLSGNLKKIWDFRQRKLSQAVKNSFYVSRTSFCFLEKLKNAQMCSFCVLTAKKNLRKLFGRLVESALVLSTATFWKKNYLSDQLFFFFLGFWV